MCMIFHWLNGRTETPWCITIMINTQPGHYNILTQSNNKVFLNWVNCESVHAFINNENIQSQTTVREELIKLHLFIIAFHCCFEGIFFIYWINLSLLILMVPVVLLFVTGMIKRSWSVVIWEYGNVHYWSTISTHMYVFKRGPIWKVGSKTLITWATVVLTWCIFLN